jgi:hypothetical protein
MTYPSIPQARRSVTLVGGPNVTPWSVERRNHSDPGPYDDDVNQNTYTEWSGPTMTLGPAL